MTISVIALGCNDGWDSSRKSGLTVAPGGSWQAGDLLIAVSGSTKAIDSVSSGWTQIASIGSGSAFLGAWWRIASGDANADKITVALSSIGGIAIGIACIRSTVGFDSSSVESHQENTAVGSGASYALGTTLSGVGAGEISVVLGGNAGTTAYNSNQTGVSGTNWTLSNAGGLVNETMIDNSGGCMVGYNTTTGTPAIPSVIYDLTSYTWTRFIFGAVIKEGAASGMAGGGLFWGAP